MIDYDQIRDVHLEISTLCNASCPWCPRNFWGYPFNDGYPETYLTLSQCKKIFAVDFLRQLKSIRINGNYGDIVMNPQGHEIVSWFLEINPELQISINTNGGARNRDFWRHLAMPGVTIFFAIDGLQDTHHLYRQNVVWKTVLKNARTFIDAGGCAVWKMIKFKHNLHQIEQAQQMSRDLKFEKFVLVDQGRDTAPVFDRSGRLTHVLGDYQGPTEFKVLFHGKINDEVLLEDIVIDRTPKQRIKCETQRLGSIYISANGDVSPCCWTGFYPKTYGKGQYHQAANKQIANMSQKNNALQHPLIDCIRWFNEIESAWKIKSYQEGRLVICDDNCGS